MSRYKFVWGAVLRRKSRGVFYLRRSAEQGGSVVFQNRVMVWSVEEVGDLSVFIPGKDPGRIFSGPVYEIARKRKGGNACSLLFNGINGRRYDVFRTDHL